MNLNQNSVTEHFIKIKQLAESQLLTTRTDHTSFIFVESIFLTFWRCRHKGLKEATRFFRIFSWNYDYINFSWWKCCMSRTKLHQFRGTNDQLSRKGYKNWKQRKQPSLLLDSKFESRIRQSSNFGVLEWYL